MSLSRRFCQNKLVKNMHAVCIEERARAEDKYLRRLREV